ncbi:MAG: fused MFS/spermidine synthase [Rubrimonas sp.]|uniref:fused MFS/spermidine synthase n=1 Tax=Rubrimonas sp. TaxID=2036015 RepID=UPI002FDDEC20
MEITHHDAVKAPLWLLILLQGAVSAASLVVEIVAGRMIAPYVGMSLYTWTAIIAVVLAGFSVGHWWGGRIAALPTPRALRLAGWTMAGAAISTAAATLLLREASGPVLQTLTHPLAAITTLTAAAFFLPSLFAGVPAPILAVAAMRGRAQSERALGAMFAAGAVGAIAGTLLAGFLFVAWLGSVATLAVITATYALAAALFFRLGDVRRGEAVAASVGVVAAFAVGAAALAAPRICDRESAYYCIRTVHLMGAPGEEIRLMVIDHLAHGLSGEADPSLMLTDHGAMLDALPRMRMGGADFAAFVIGGGSYSVPRAWAERGVREVVVSEIDPEVTAQAVEDFWFAEGAADVLHVDARAALQASDRRYDVIVADAFHDIAAPAHLVTEEFFRLVRSRLTDRGVFAVNLIDYTGRLDALAAFVVTLREVFPSVEVWTDATPPAGNERRIFVLLASDTDSPVSAVDIRAPQVKRFAALDAGFLDAIIARKGARKLTDDHAPIARLMGLEPIID